MTSAADPILKASGLSVSFANQNGQLIALDEVTFSINRHAFVCLLGPSGSGKSTLLRIIGGLLEPSAGEVALNGERLRGPNSGVGYVFQEPNLMPWRSVIENILLPLELRDGKTPDVLSQAKSMIELVGLTGFEDYLPRDLSGGMAQRVAIARTLMQDPDLLLLDEPFGALDALTRERMGEELLQIWQARQKTIVMVTHAIDEAIFLADRVLVLSAQPGRLVLDLPVNFPRPRSSAIRYTTQFGALAGQIREAIA